MIVAAAALLFLRLLHPSADFPSHSRWIDEPGRYTDEGWYAAGAIHHVLDGRWIIPGDFNPIVSVPGWPAIISGVFAITGVSMAAARTTSILFGIVLVLFATLLFRMHHRRNSWIVFVLLAVNATLFVFSRLALLETPMMAFFLAAMLVAPRRGQAAGWRVPLCAVVLTAAILIKSSALFLLPALLLYVWEQNREAGRPVTSSFRLPIAIAAIVAALIGAYWLAVVAPHMVDARVLKQENFFGVERRSPEKVPRVAFRMFTWADPVLFLAALGAAVLSLRSRALRETPLVLFSILWIIGYSLFCILHLTADPRYFVTFVVPLAFLAVILYQQSAPENPKVHRFATLALCASGALNAVETVSFILRPQYTFADAAQQLASTIRNSGDPHPLVLGHGAIESSLFTRIDALDNIGSISLEDKLDTYHPGWLVLWSNDEEFAARPAILSRYQPIQQGAWAVMDQPIRSHLLLYRLQPRQPK